MTIRVVMSGATGWVGKALIPAIVAEVHKDADRPTMAEAVAKEAVQGKP